MGGGLRFKSTNGLEDKIADCKQLLVMNGQSRLVVTVSVVGLKAYTSRNPLDCSITGDTDQAQDQIFIHPGHTFNLAANYRLKRR